MECSKLDSFNNGLTENGIMSILGSSDEDVEECYVCGKEVEPDECVEYEGKKFCCEKCRDRFEEEQEEKEDVCKFC